MTYARARLWLGISGVGAFVVVGGAMLIVQVLHRLLPDTVGWRLMDLIGLVGFAVGFVTLMLAIDLLGGYYR